MGRRDYAILMMLVKLGLRANEVATLTLDDIVWRSGEMVVRAKGRQRARMPIAPASAQRSLPTCVMVARRRHVAGCFFACQLLASDLRPVARLR